MRVCEGDFAQQQVQRDHEHRKWYHHGRQYSDKQHALSTETELGKHVAEDRTREEDAKGDYDRYIGAVEEVPDEVQLNQYAAIALERHLMRYQNRRIGQHLLRYLDARYHHPEERKQHRRGPGYQKRPFERVE